MVAGFISQHIYFVGIGNGYPNGKRISVFLAGDVDGATKHYQQVFLINPYFVNTYCNFLG
jgi:hypothetical protein